MTTPPGALPDLIITSARVSLRGYTGGCVTAYSPMITTVCVKNQGLAAAGRFAVRAVGSAQHMEWQVLSLEAGAWECLEQEATGSGEVKVDADDEVVESDETNNLGSLAVPTAPALCTVTPTATATSTTPAPGSTTTPSPTAGRTATASPTPAPSPTRTATTTRSATPTRTATTTSSPTPTRTATRTATPTQTASPGADPAIAGIQYDGNDEWITIMNWGGAPQVMTGWSIQSYSGTTCQPVAGQVYSFPSGYILAPGESVRVHSGPSAIDNPPSDLLWLRENIWANGGDRGDLRAPDGRVVDSYGYGKCQ